MDGSGSSDPLAGPLPADDPSQRLKALLEVVGKAVSTVAGAAAFLYVVGAAVLWIRLTKAQLPADHALGVLPRHLLISVGMRKVVLPAIAAGLVFYALANGLQERRRRRNL